MEFNLDQSLTPRAVLERATTEKLTDKEGKEIQLQLAPPLAADDLEERERFSGNLIPSEIRDFLEYASGFSIVNFENHYWSKDIPLEIGIGGIGDFGLEEVFPRSIPLLADGCGNFWVADVNPESGLWGPIFFACHDPPVVVIQASSLTAFLEQIFDIFRPGHRDALEDITEIIAQELWGDNMHLPLAADSRASDDPIVSRFSATLPEDYRLADLRAKTYGTGFTWGTASKWDVKRHNTDLLFGISPRRSFFGRLFRRK